jgi:hypothetical protein
VHWTRHHTGGIKERRYVKRAIAALGIPLVVLTAGATAVALAGTTGITACGGPTDPVELCARLHVGLHGIDYIDFEHEDCGVSMFLSNAEYNVYGEITAFDFDIRCTTSSERYTGHVWDVQSTDHNSASAWKATVNGVDCRYP